MEVIDVSVPIRPGMPVWPGDPVVEVGLAASVAAGELANVTRVALSAHTGTHVDAPCHFFEGAGGVETLPLDALVGPCVVVEAEAVAGELTPAAFSGLAPDVRRVLFKTANSELWARPDFVEESICLSTDAAAEAVRRRLRLVAIDYLTIGGPEAHRTLLAAGVVPLEGVDLRGVEPGPYRLVCLPLLLAGADGAPARTVLLRG